MMEKKHDTEKVIIVVEPDSEQVSKLESEMSDCTLHRAPPDWPEQDNIKIPVDQMYAILVFARLNQEDHTISLCKKIRKITALQHVPLLVAINRFQMMLGNDVKRMPHSYFIITPIDRSMLEEKIKKIRIQA